MDFQREKDIQELCKQILKGMAIDYGVEWTNEVFCCFCGSETSATDEAYAKSIIKRINHKENCAYLIAKDLSTK